MSEPNDATIYNDLGSIGTPILRDEEDEPDFRPLLERTKARAAELGRDGDGPLLAALLDMIDHLYGEIDAMENHISDYGPPCEAEDEPGFFESRLK